MKPELQRLGDLCYMRSGGTPRRGVEGFYGGSIPWVTIADMTASSGVVMKTAESITQAGLAAIGNRLFDAGTILLAMYGSVGKLAIAGTRLATNQAILGITPREESKLNQRYLTHWLGSIQSELLNGARGVTQANISKGFVEELLVPVPGPHEQRRIADILDKADAIRRKRKEAIALTDELLRSTFLEMFGDPVTNPKGWPIRPFEELVAETRLGLVRAAADQGPDRAFPYIRMNAIRGDGNLDLSNLVRVDANHDDLRLGVLLPGDFLFNTRNSKELVGKSGIFYGTTPHLFNNNILRVRFKKTIQPEFVNAYWQTNEAQRQLEARKSGTTSVFAIYAKNLSTIPVPVPPAELQVKFTSICASIRRDTTTQKQYSEEADVLFDALVERAFSGGLGG